MDEQDEVQIETEDIEIEGEEKVESKIAKMREELSACRKDKQEYMDGWQRSKADYVNLLKRIESDGKILEQRGRVDALQALLPAMDALERAKDHGEVPVDFQAIVKQLEGAFASQGMEPVGEVGEKFNPAIHEAFGTDPADSAALDDTVTAVLEKGWKIGDSVVRPAKVRVAHFASE